MFDRYGAPEDREFSKLLLLYICFVNEILEVCTASKQSELHLKSVVHTQTKNGKLVYDHKLDRFNKF